MAAILSSSHSNQITSVRPPPLTQSDAITSLLSLSIAAATDLSPTDATSTGSHLTAPSTTTAGKHHRRLGSTGKTRRRLSDAREASARPLLGTTPTSSAALSLASLSLSTSPPSAGHGHSHSLGANVPHVIGHGHAHSYSHSHGYSPLAPKPTAVQVPAGVSIAIVSGSAPDFVPVTSDTDNDKPDGDESGATPIAISGGKTKKRGVDYRCESCAKIYRHPNCLNKHRWEHTRQWREASKFVLSKHQQVQLLEAAAILSYMGKDPTSLPEDRSEWPSFLSGGSLPKADPAAPPGSASSGAGAPMPAYGSIGHGAAQRTTRATTTYALQPQSVQVSASVPNPSTVHMHMPQPISAANSGGPRMHDYALETKGGGVKRVAPGLVGVPTPVPAGESGAVGGGWSLPSSSVRGSGSGPVLGVGSVPASLSYSYSGTSTSRSASRSRSRSGSGSSVDVDVVGDDDDEMDGGKPKPKAYGGPRIITPAPAMSQSPGYGYAYGYSTPTAGAGYGGGYPQSYGRRGGMGMKREEDEMSVGFSVREEDEDEDDERDETTAERKWDGMEMEVDMDMD